MHHLIVLMFFPGNKNYAVKDLAMKILTSMFFPGNKNYAVKLGESGRSAAHTSKTASKEALNSQE